MTLPGPCLQMCDGDDCVSSLCTLCECVDDQFPDSSLEHRPAAAAAAAKPRPVLFFYLSNVHREDTTVVQLEFSFFY